MFDRSASNGQFLYRRLDCCCPTSGQPEKGRCEYEDGGKSPWLEESARTGESWATPRLGAKDPDHLLKIIQDLDQHNYREVNYTSAHFQHERRDHDQ
jgi:hypothetical protein